MIPKGIQETLRIALYRARAYYRLGRAKEIEQPPLTDWEQLLANTTQALDWLNKPYGHRNGETEPPTVEGYYWIRYGQMSSILHVFDRGDGQLMVQIIGDWGHRSLRETDEQWYGPIPEPETQHDTGRTPRSITESR